MDIFSIGSLEVDGQYKRTQFRSRPGATLEKGNQTTLDGPSNLSIETEWLDLGTFKTINVCEILGHPNLQKEPETLLPRARLRAFSKLFLDLASFF